MSSELLDALAEDCKVLLSRALVGNTLNVYGIDGMGQYGTSDRAMSFAVNDLSVFITPESDLHDIRGICYLKLENYDADRHGIISTDKNLQISLNALLTAVAIDKTCWTWADVDSQGTDYLTIKIDVNKLIEW